MTNPCAHLVVEPGPGLGDGGGVGEHADGALHLGQVAAGDHGGRLVVDPHLGEWVIYKRSFSHFTDLNTELKISKWLFSLWVVQKGTLDQPGTVKRIHSGPQI